MQDFTDRIILVTGATSGIGRAAVLQLAKAGAQVIAAARREDRGRELVEAAGPNVQFLPLDIADAASIDRLFAAIEADYRRLDGAFNNAGTETELTPLPETSVAEFDRVFATNVRGTWLCLRHEMRIMRAQRSGAIVNTASTTGITGIPRASVYTASKHAIVGMTKSAGLELAEMGVRVNVLCPGGTRSEMSARWVEGLENGYDTLAQGIPMKRVASADEQASVALFLLSDASSYMTGTTIIADGGYTAI